MDRTAYDRTWKEHVAFNTTSDALMAKLYFKVGRKATEAIIRTMQDPQFNKDELSFHRTMDIDLHISQQRRERAAKRAVSSEPHRFPMSIVIEEILDFVQNSGHFTAAQTMKRLSLTSRTLTYACQRRLQRNIQFKFRTASVVANRFLRSSVHPDWVTHVDLVDVTDLSPLMDCLSQLTNVRVLRVRYERQVPFNFFTWLPHMDRLEQLYINTDVIFAFDGGLQELAHCLSQGHFPSLLKLEWEGNKACEESMEEREEEICDQYAFGFKKYFPACHYHTLPQQARERRFSVKEAIFGLLCYDPVYGQAFHACKHLAWILGAVGLTKLTLDRCLVSHLFEGEESGSPERPQLTALLPLGQTLQDLTLSLSFGACSLPQHTGRNRIPDPFKQFLREHAPVLSRLEFQWLDAPGRAGLLAEAMNCLPPNLEILTLRHMPGRQENGTDGVMVSHLAENAGHCLKKVTIEWTLPRDLGQLRNQPPAKDVLPLTSAFCQERGIDFEEIYY